MESTGFGKDNKNEKKDLWTKKHRDMLLSIWMSPHFHFSPVYL
jgi:hypothetical protein